MSQATLPVHKTGHIASPICPNNPKHRDWQHGQSYWMAPLPLHETGPLPNPLDCTKKYDSAVRESGGCSAIQYTTGPLALHPEALRPLWTLTLNEWMNEWMSFVPREMDTVAVVPSLFSHPHGMEKSKYGIPEERRQTGNVAFHHSQAFSS